MHDYAAPFRGKRITILGLGLLGRGVGDAAFLARCGAEVLVTDKKSGSELAASVDQLKKYPNISFKLGGHDEADVTQCDMLIKAAGVRLDSPEVAAARAAGVEVAMSTALFAKYAREAGAIIVGVTGTRGKSTITHMIYHALERAGRRVHLGGNVRGVSTLAQLPNIERGDCCVLELDSWQLQGFGDLVLSPHVAVFSNLMPDHQNYYKNMDEYFSDKANIFRYQKEGDTLVIGRGIEPRVRAGNPPVEPLVPSALAPDWMLQVPGEHNRENAALAAAALLALGLNSAQIRDGLESFTAVEGRLQYLGEKKGVAIYNDNNATTPEATIAALGALDGGKKNIILIAGGSDKGLDMSGMRAAIHAHCKAVVLLAGTGTERIRADAPDVPVFNSLKEAVDAAFDRATAGDIILFSPAFASFGMFTNEYERNDEFVRAIQSI